MFLSNGRKYFLLLAFLVLFLQACGGARGNENVAQIAPIEEKGEFPFSTKEPEVYQAVFVVTGGGVENKWFVVRNQDRSRIDFYQNGELVRTRLTTDAMYSIDYKRKVYTAISVSEGTVADLTDKFFKGKAYRKFEKLGSDGGMTKYKAVGENPGDEVLITYDDAKSMIVRQEFRSPKSDTAVVVFELKDLKMEAADNLFAIPAGYRRIGRDEFYQTHK